LPLFKRAAAWMREANEDGFDAVAIAIDQDGDTVREEKFDKAQMETIVSGRSQRALGVAIRSFDAWILADEQALTAALSVAVQCQKDPERNRDPKQTCVELLESSDREISRRGFYTEIANHVDFKILSARCPDGFGVFLNRLRNDFST
jgi:hypothetical protein